MSQSVPPRKDREGKRGGCGHGGRGGRGGGREGGGARRGHGSVEGQDGDGSGLRRFASADSLNGSSRGNRGRGKGGRGRGGKPKSAWTDEDAQDKGRGRRGKGGFNGGSGHSNLCSAGEGRGREEGGGRGGGDRGGDGGGNRGPNRGNRPKNSFFPLRHIAKMEDVDEVIMRVTSQLPELKLLLCAESLSTDDTVSVLQILSRVVQNDLQRESVLKVLHVVCTSRFLDTHLTSLIQIGLPSMLRSEGLVIEVVELVHQLLSQICLKLPSNASKPFLLLTGLSAVPSVVSLLERKKPRLAESVKELLEESRRCMAQLHHSGQKKAQRTKVRRGPNDDDEIPPEDFTELPVFPSYKDMDWTEKIFLRVNKEEGAFRDVSHYLDVQFRLLREDYIRPLRQGIKEFKQLKSKGEKLKKSQDLRLYHDVHIISMICKDSLEHRLQFSMTPQLQKMRWQSSRRLLYGSLVCLTPDDFDTIFFAIVTNRDTKDLEKGIIQVHFENGLDDIMGMSSGETFTMAETTAYFEAYRHVLEGLQEMKDALPMARYLVDCNPTIKPPQYLLSATGTGQMDLSSLLCEDSRWDASAVTIINPQRWPPLKETELNASQLEAVRTALSKELAIIQGPPGTGKTYVGLKVAKVLLENREVWMDPEVGSRPILVVCYTNHALDQFLEGILDFCPTGIVRVGSRCQNPQLEEFNLKNIRKERRTNRKISLSVRNSIRDCVRNLKMLEVEVMAVSAKLEATTKGVVGEGVLQPFMLPEQYDSLMRRSQFTAPPTSASPGNVMMEWLTNGAIMLAGEETEEGDPYAVLAAEVTKQILQGEGMCQESNVDPNEVHLLAPRVKAQLYRLWLQRVLTTLQKDVGERVSQMWQQAARREVLPDSLLQRVINAQLYAAITSPMMHQHQQLTQFCFRAWLGVSEGATPEVTSHITGDGQTVNEAQVSPDEVTGLPRKTRVQLYRFWLQRAKKDLKNQMQQAKRREQDPETLASVLELAQRDVLPDEVLKNYVDLKLFTAIRKEMLQRHERQSQYLIRAWLGLQEFCQNPLDLEKLLRQLEDEDEDEDEQGRLNVEEEADVIQKERQLDDYDEDDLFDFGQKHSKNLDVNSAMQALGVQPTSTARRPQNPKDDDDAWIVPNYQKKQQAKKLQRLLTSSKPMGQEEAERVVNLWSEKLSLEERVRLYLFWLHNYQDRLRESVRDQADEYDQESRQLRELRLGEDKDILVERTVIGMTTTGAARYRRVLAAVACPIVILEEAAEVLEAHVVTTLHKKCQHLILIGDHQQLRPSPTVYELCRHYKLDLSLFERLVNNNLPHSTLAVQHRMRPEVARLVRHVYPELKDHGTTVGRPHIRGVKQDVFLFHHEMQETRNDETSSKSNQYEAELCVRLCRYLLQQGYPPDTVTILTAYSGQVFALKNIMKKEQTFYQGVRVTAVDNYQGEENDVIILSLVRSNQEGSVGFLGTDNRVCVALSRARNGFYAFGNFKILAASSELWRNICHTAKYHGQLGDTLVLRCETHPDQENRVTTAKDFDKSPEGGCKLPCGTRLDKCGHVCELMCHGYDRDHQQYKCRKKCERRPCKLGHPCTKKCFQDCGQCLYKMEKTVPMCGHVATMECKKDPHTWKCQERCEGKLPCGHQCSGSCGDCRTNKSHSVVCTEEVEKVWPCGHLIKTACNVQRGEWPCNRPCGVTLDCGHVCKGTCGTCCSGRVHVACKEKCGRALPGCGHKCRLPCGTECLPCQEKSCGTSCRHSNCKQPCGTPCPPCNEACPWKSCRHRECDALCHQPCPPCAQTCGKKLKCGRQDSPEGQGHFCSGLCGEKCFCFTCDRKNFVPLVIDGVLTEEESVAVGEDTKLIKLPRCGHIFNATVLDVYVTKKCQNLPPGCSLTCPVATCNKMILEADCWRYNRLLRERHDRFQKAKQELMTATTISRGRRQKLLNSLALLTHDAEQEKSFASKAARGQIFKKDDIDVNTAFALTNQIKLASVFEVTLKVLKDSDRLSDLRSPTKKDVQTLQKLLYTPARFLTQQRLRELRMETLRMALTTKLACTTTAGCHDSDLVLEMQRMLLQLASGAELQGPFLEEVDALLRSLRRKCQPEWSRTMDIIDTSVLTAPPEQDLCDIVLNIPAAATATSTPRPTTTTKPASLASEPFSLSSFSSSVAATTTATLQPVVTTRPASGAAKATPSTSVGTTTRPTPQPAVSARPAPQPVVSTRPTPQPVVSTIPTPQTVISTRPTSQPVVSTRPTTQSAVSTKPTSQPVLSTRLAPQSAVSTRPTPQPVVSTRPTPQPVVSTRPTTQSAVSSKATAQPVLSTRPAPQSAVSTRPAPQPAVSTRPTPQQAASDRPASVSSAKLTPSRSTPSSSESRPGLALAGRSCAESREAGSLVVNSGSSSATSLAGRRVHPAATSPSSQLPAAYYGSSAAAHNIHRRSLLVETDTRAERGSLGTSEARPGSPRPTSPSTAAGGKSESKCVLS